MIIARCNSIKDKIVEVEKINGIREEITTLNSCSEELNKLIDNIRNSLNIYRLLQVGCGNDIALTVFNVNDFKDKILKKNEIILCAFKDDYTSLTKGRNYKDLLKYLGDLDKDLLSYNNALWSQYIELLSSCFTGHKGLINSLPCFSNYVEQIEKAQETFNELTSSFPQSQDVFDELSTIIKKVEGLTNNLPDDLPESVKTFFANVRNAGAPLSMIFENEEIICWLKKYNMLDDLFIKI